MHSNVFLRELRGNDQHESLGVVGWADAHSLVGSFGRHRRRGCSVGRELLGGRDGVGWVGGGSGALSRWLLSPSRSVTSRFRGIIPTRPRKTSGLFCLWVDPRLVTRQRGTMADDNNWEGQERERTRRGFSPCWHRSLSRLVALVTLSKAGIQFPQATAAPRVRRGYRRLQLDERLPFEFRKYPGAPVRRRSKRETLRRKFDPSAPNQRIH